MSLLHKPRVMLYSSAPRSDRGGVQRVLEGLEAALPQQGLVTLRAGPDEGGSGYRLEAGAEATSSGRPALFALPKAALTLARLALCLKRFRPDVINVHFPTGTTLYFLALRPLFRYRLVLSVHGSDILRPTAQMRRHLPRFLAAADAVTVVSNDLATKVETMTAGQQPRISVIPNGVDPAFWSPGEVESQQAGNRMSEAASLVAIGRLLPVKGFDVLIEALANLPQAQLEIIGAGTERERLESLARHHGVQNRLLFSGHLSAEAVRRRMRSADLLVMPSRSEGLPLTLLEALCCGLPVVASDVGAVGEVLTVTTGKVVPPEDAQRLAQTIASALALNSGLSRAEARARGLQYSAAVAYTAYVRVFDKVLEQKGRGASSF